ncbi:MAG TPA: J domain-containing protein [Acidimicrobiia bacterium]|nr:J domain-containing protein [Acidimicrobiia bacterium]
MDPLDPLDPMAPTILSELSIRHTRRHQPTRRVAVDGAYLPTSGNGYGAVLLGAVVAEHVAGLDEEQQDLLPRFLREARRGELDVPTIALRYRLQTDVHGLDRSRHRFVSEAFHALSVLELDVHGSAAPQVIGVVMAAAAMGPTARARAFRAIDAGLARAGALPEGVIVRRLEHGVPGALPPPPGSGHAAGSGGPYEAWRGIPAERRWAMEVLGVQAGIVIDRGDIQQRFRRLLRIAHPDQGGESRGAAERIAELSEARDLLLAGFDGSASYRAGASA